MGARSSTLADKESHMTNYEPRKGTKARTALDAIRAAGLLTPIEIAGVMQTSVKSVQSLLSTCLRHKLLVKVGRGEGTYYQPATDVDHVEGLALDVGGADNEVQPAGDLVISIWSDGDVMVEGATVHTDSGNKVVFTLRQIEQLVRMVARPMVQVGA